MKEIKKPENTIFYSNYKDMIYNATPEEVKEIMTAFCKYAFDEEEPEVSGQIKLLWGIIKGNIDRDRSQYIARCEQNRENALKRYEEKSKEKVTYTLNGHEYELIFPTENKSNIFTEEIFKCMFGELDSDENNLRHNYLKILIDMGNKDKWNKPYETYEKEVWQKIYQGAI